MKLQKKIYNISSEEININIFKKINIHFTGDVYLLAVWVAMSDRAKSTPTCHSHTTLTGFAKTFSSTYGIDYSNPLDDNDVMEIFRRHGIKGNPCLQLDEENKLPYGISLMTHDKMLSKKKLNEKNTK